MKRMKRRLYSFLNGSGLCRLFTRPAWKPIIMKKVTASLFFLLLLFFFLLAAASLGWFDTSMFSGIGFQGSIPSEPTADFPLKCNTAILKRQTCPSIYYYPTATHNLTNYPDRTSPSSKVTCPSYFRWIYEDLRPWAETGITRKMIERGRRNAHFRLVIVNGKAYVKKYKKSIQTRDIFTLWGILQLLRLYPGRLPDLELMFDCNDRPVVRSRDFRGPNSGPPPVFRYCSDEWNLDIVFPDWSFWGWAETNIRPWSNVAKGIKEGNKRSKWEDRVPYAYWRGNPNVDPGRKDLMKCNVSNTNDWNTRLYIQDWDQESKQGFKQSNLGDQCTHRYKIYIEGWAWSVSEKYILACDSMTLYVKPRYYNFFIRGMTPLQHYWPIRDDSKCTSLKFSVEWGNNHTKKAQAIGKAASNFIQEDLKMENVYDYMFHLLNEYAKLLKFKPSIPWGAVELCAETMACRAAGPWRKSMKESFVMSPTDRTPCSIPLPYDPPSLLQFLETKANATRQVEIWENEYWDNLENKQQ